MLRALFSKEQTQYQKDYAAFDEARKKYFRIKKEFFQNEVAAGEFALARGAYLDAGKKITPYFYSESSGVGAVHIPPEAKQAELMEWVFVEAFVVEDKEGVQAVNKSSKFKDEKPEVVLARCFKDESFLKTFLFADKKLNVKSLSFIQALFNAGPKDPMSSEEKMSLLNREKILGSFGSLKLTLVQNTLYKFLLNPPANLSQAELVIVQQVKDSVDAIMARKWENARDVFKKIKANSFKSGISIYTRIDQVLFTVIAVPQPIYISRDDRLSLFIYYPQGVEEIMKDERNREKFMQIHFPFVEGEFEDFFTPRVKEYLEANPELSQDTREQIQGVLDKFQEYQQAIRAQHVASAKAPLPVEDYVVQPVSSSEEKDKAVTTQPLPTSRQKKSGEAVFLEQKSEDYEFKLHTQKDLDAGLPANLKKVADDYSEEKEDEVIRSLFLVTPSARPSRELRRAMVDVKYANSPIPVKDFEAIQRQLIARMIHHQYEAALLNLHYAEQAALDAKNDWQAQSILVRKRYWEKTKDKVKKCKAEVLRLQALKTIADKGQITPAMQKEYSASTEWPALFQYMAVHPTVFTGTVHDRADLARSHDAKFLTSQVAMRAQLGWDSPLVKQLSQFKFCVINNSKRWILWGPTKIDEFNRFLSKRPIDEDKLNKQLRRLGLRFPQSTLKALVNEYNHPKFTGQGNTSVITSKLQAIEMTEIKQKSPEKKGAVLNETEQKYPIKTELEENKQAENVVVLHPVEFPVGVRAHEPTGDVKSPVQVVAPLPERKLYPSSFMVTDKPVGVVAHKPAGHIKSKEMKALEDWCAVVAKFDPDKVSDATQAIENIRKDQAYLEKGTKGFADPNGVFERTREKLETDLALLQLKCAVQKDLAAAPLSPQEEKGPRVLKSR